MKYSIEITPRILAEMDSTQATQEAFPSYSDYLNCLWDMIELTDDEDIYYKLMDNYFSSDQYYIDLWEKLLPILRNRIRNDKPVSYNKILYGLYNWGPGKHSNTIHDHISNWLPRIYSKTVKEFPKEVIELIANNYDLPYDWEKELENQDEYDEYED